ncbi:hypothetical protein BCR33DRAFT_678920 [Rhizoclosmatium globosum]|uniref:Uncharacterized protein n=1 Tax=Rhizoclosmatium globosum TaxID=329046 RepID=A0A1Y2CET4_9FUNG|nr:hypothetical protein BCR33DRAFT_678920 [Rhizoclosmatium globosum]|eukprot:ORY45563.1 hypothetical protein BCR33DRAFT_678920 [Rhizoclosmatium globosum]
MEQLVVDLQAVTISIANVESELTEVDWLLQMEESDWPRTAQLKYGDHPTLRQEKIDLRQEKKDLRRKEAYLLKEKEQLNAMKLLEKEMGRVMLESSPVVPPIQSPLTEHDGPAKLFIPNTADNTLRGYFHRNNAEGETFSKFMTVAVGLQNDPSLLAIVHKINSIPKEWSNLNTPFVFLEGSSGTGKTQTAFALLNLLAASTQVLYFLYLPVGEHAQPIYKCFQAVSKLFNACADKDQNMLDSPSCGSLIELDLHLFGFILAFLQNCGSSNHTQVIIGDQVEIKSVKGSVVKDYLRSNYSTKSLPVVIVDECNTSNNENRLRLMRNIFRCLGLRLVMLGTDSQVMELLESTGAGSRAGPITTWCHVMNCLPKLWIPGLGIPNNVPTHLLAIIHNSRPWFAQIASKYLHRVMIAEKKAPTLDDMVQEVFNHIITEKNIFDNEYGRLGQIRLFLNKSYRGSSSSALIHSHFAQIADLENVTLNNRMQKLGSTQKWAQIVEFPSIESDILLYLSLMGGLKTNAFIIGSAKVPFLHYFDHYANTSRARQEILNLGNAAQDANDGTELESTLATAVCVASHCGGVNGIPIQSFLKELIYNLQRSLTNSDLTIDMSCLPVSVLDNFQIPFLSPPGIHWPAWIPGCFGNLTRSVNKEKVDLSTSCGLSGECKDYGNSLSSNTIIEILRRVPDSSKLHLVLTRKLQKSYFTKNTYEMKVTNSKRLAVCQVDSVVNPPVISPISGIPFGTTPECVVLFIICPRIKA